MRFYVLPLYAIVCILSTTEAGISFNLPANQAVIRRNGAYTEFDDAMIFGRPGEPALPVTYTTLLLPPDADLRTVVVTIQGVRELSLEGEHTVRPFAPLSTTDGLVALEGRTLTRDGYDAGVYSADTYFPHNCIRYVQTGQLRDYKLVDVAVQRYRYNPVSGSLKSLEQGSLVVTYATEHQRPSLTHGVPATTYSIVKDVADNFDEFAALYASLRILSRAGYALITTSAIKNASTALTKFIAIKKAEGFSVQLVTESDWGGGTGDAAMNNIRTWLKTNYRERAIEYAFILGSADVTSQVPMTYGPTASDKTPLIDYCYADLTGSEWDVSKNRYYEYSEEGVADIQFDKYAEVHVGRIPVYNDNITDLDNLLNKIIKYVTEPKSEAEAWRFNAIMPLHTFGDAQNGWVFGEYVKNNVLVPNKWKYFRVYDDHMGLGAEGYPCSYENVKNYWNAGKFGAMVWQAHGMVTFAEQVMSSGTAAGLKDDYPAHGIGISCHNGRPQDPANVGFAVFKYSCISMIASAVQIWYNQSTSNYGSRAAGNDFAYVYFKHLIGSKLPAAAAFNKGRSELPITATSDWQNCTELNLYGCPAVGVYTYDVPSAAAHTTISRRPLYCKIINKNSSRTLTILFTKGNSYNTAAMSLYDMHGKLVAQKAIADPGTTVQWHLHEGRAAVLSNGLYLVRVEVQDSEIQQQSYRTKVLIQ